MPIHSGENLFFDPTHAQPMWGHLPTGWLTRAQDPRPKCTLVLGDGFTQDFLHAHALNDVVKSSIGGHFKNWPDLRYLTTKNETRFPNGDPNFWTPEKWPRLFAEFERLKPTSAMDFYEQLAKERINPDRKTGRWSVRSDSVAYELRCYLWRFFRSWDRIIDARLQQPPLPNWIWATLLYLLAAEFRLTVITFNYDRVFEKVFVRGIPGENQLYRLCVGTHENAELAAANIVHLIKIHGSIDLNFATAQETTIGYRSTPWIDDPFVFERNLVMNIYPNFIDDLSVMPLIPELVPPGHQGDHLCTPNWAAPDLSKSYLSESDVTIFCGLAARKPDTEEIEELVKAMPTSSPIVQVGRTDFGDRENPLAIMLSQHCSSVSFVDARDLNQVHAVLAKSGLLRKDWGSTFASPP